MRGFIAKYEDLIFYAGYKINNEIASAALRAPKMTAKIKKTVIKLLNNNIIFGKSYGIKRYNKILEVVSDNIANTQSFVFDDPFDGMDNNTISKLSNVISQLQNLGVNFLIFTNNIEAYRTIKLSNGNFSGFIIEKYFNKFIFENITDVDNIIFKYNDYKYYEQLDQLLMRWDIHISIRELILACHRQYLYESKELLNLTVASKSIIKSVESIYNFSTDALKIRITAPKLINKKYRSKEISLLPQIAGNYIEHIILLLRTNTMSDAFYWQSNNFYFLNKILLKTFITSLYDSALKRIESLIDDTKLIQKNSANFCSVIRKKIRTFESTRDKIAHPREHMFISNHLAINSEELEIWLDIFVYCIDLNRIKLISNTSQEIRKFKELESRSKK